MNQDTKLHGEQTPENEIGRINLLSLYKVFLLHTQLPQYVVDILNTYTDSVVESKNKKSLADGLVGQIRQDKQSGQWVMDHMHPDLAEFRNVCLNMCDKFVEGFYELKKYDRQEKEELIGQIDRMWSVHSYAGDYNPIHAHGGPTIRMLSLVVWTKVPGCIRKIPFDDPLIGATGNSDGFIDFMPEPAGVNDEAMFKFTGGLRLKPEVGKVWVFPSWLNHMVWPFTGEGERRTISMNVSMWPPEQLDPERREIFDKIRGEDLADGTEIKKPAFKLT